MKKFEHCILYSDMDGTLLNREGVVSEENIKAIQYFVEEGGCFGVAIGRSQLNSLMFIEDLPVNLPCILYNGCAVYDFNKHQFLKMEELKKEGLGLFLQQVMLKYSKISIQIYSSDMCHFITKEEQADPYHVESHQPCEFTSLDAIRSIPWIKILFSGHMEDLKTMNAEMLERGLQNEIDYVYSSNIYLEYLPKGVSKGSALRYIREQMGNQYEFYAVGDYDNDLEMLEVADCGIAMGNAVPRLKEIANLVTVDHNDHAMEDIIYRIIENGCSC